jgi:hypothetical protein
MVLRTLLVIVAMMFVGVTTTTAQSGPSVSVSTRFTEPAYLGQSMTVWIAVQNQASIPMQVQSVIVSFDWYSTLNGNTPRVLQAGETSTWEFDNIQIPSATWTGKHSFDASVMVGWADSSGGWSNTLSSPLHVTTNFAVQEAPPPPTFAVTNTLAITVNQNVPNNSISGFPLESILFGAIVAIVLLIAKRRRQSN